MVSLPSFLRLVHIVGLALGVGAATVKTLLLLRSLADRSLLPAYLRVARPITQQIILGMVLLTLSGAGWLLYGYPFTTLLAVKLVIVAGLWVLGPVIDNMAEPRFRALVPLAGEPASPAFDRARRQYVALEVAATSLFYAAILIWVR
jgi:hypothetical protein